MTSTNRRTQAAPAQHHQLSPVLGPVVAVLSTYAAGALVDTMGVPRAVVAWITVLTTCGLVITVTVANITGWPRLWITGSWLFAGAWTFWAAWASPWAWPPVVALLGGGATLGPLWPLAARQIAEQRVPRTAEAIAMQAGQEGADWIHALARAGCKGLRFVSQDEPRPGLTAVHLRLPASRQHGNASFGRLQEQREQIEVTLGLPLGAVRFERGRLARDITMFISTRDVLAELIPLPDEHDPTSINDPFPIGLFADGDLSKITLREVCALIVGVRGKGKSNLINVLISQITRTTDALVWMIDVGKSGRTARPWLAPWFRRLTGKPVLDWVATTPAEADRMINAFGRAIAYRAAAYGGEDEKITPDAWTPAIILVCEEMAALTGYRSSTPGKAVMANELTTAVSLGRSEATDAILCTQRGTVTMGINGDLKSQCDLRIGLGVTSAADARAIIPDDAKIAADLSRLTHEGTGIVQYKHGRVMPLKFFRMEPTDIGRTATLHADRRPALDEGTARHLGAVYAERWTSERAGHLAPDAGQGNAVAVMERPAPAAQQQTGGDPAGSSGPSDRELFDQIVEAHLGDLADVAPPTGGGAGPDDADGAGGYDAEPPADEPQDGKPQHPAKARLLEMLGDYGERGQSPSQLAKRLEREGIGVARETVSRWLAQYAKQGLVRDAGHGRWALPDQ